MGHATQPVRISIQHHGYLSETLTVCCHTWHGLLVGHYVDACGSVWRRDLKDHPQTAAAVLHSMQISRDFQPWEWGSAYTRVYTVVRMIDKW